MISEAHRHFHDELSRLKDRLLAMSSEVQEALGLALKAILDRDAAAAEQVIAGDRKIDLMEVEIEDTVTNLLALHQPMAKDLRLLLAAFKIASDLERVGDHAVNLAQGAQRLVAARPITPKPELVEMARIAREMLSGALEAFVRGDAKAGRAICARDDSVDALNRSLFRIMLTHMAEDPQTITSALDLLLVSRNLERVADLATNVAEEVVFLVEGHTIKHHVGEK